MTIPKPIIFIVALLLGLAILAPDSQVGGDLLTGAQSMHRGICE